MIDPVLVYGARKNGTTLLQSLIDGGNELMMVPGELRIKQLYDKDFCEDVVRKKFYFSKGRSMFAKCFSEEKSGNYMLNNEYHIGTLSQNEINRQFDIETYLKKLRSLFQRKDMTIKDIIDFDVSAYKDSLLNKKSYKYWASKTVGGNPDIIIPYFKALYPNAKFIFITRDPKFIIRSIFRNRRRKNVKLSFKDMFLQCRSAYRVVKYLSQCDNWENCILVSYEKLVSQTTIEMKRIADFLNINCKENFSIPTNNGD